LSGDTPEAAFAYAFKQTDLNCVKDGSGCTACCLLICKVLLT
jgi:hypothetical protein